MTNTNTPPANARWQTCPEDQGQSDLVEYAIDWEGSIVWRRTTFEDDTIRLEFASTEEQEGEYEPHHQRPAIGEGGWEELTEEEQGDEAIIRDNDEAERASWGFGDA